MHVTIILLIRATPRCAMFANSIITWKIGPPDVAFPRLNMFSYWLFSLGGFLAIAGFLTPRGAASFGWTAYPTLSLESYSPGLGSDMWVTGLIMTGFGTIFGAVNFITTILTMRAPGMTMFRMPIFTWNTLLTSVLILMAFPLLAAALFGLGADRILGSQVFAAEHGGVLLWHRLFWSFGQLEVTIYALSFFGVVTEILPVFCRQPVFAYTGRGFATFA